MADIFSAIVGFFGVSTQIGEYIITPIKNQFSYLFGYNYFLKSLRDEVERLEITRATLQLGIDVAIRNVEVIGPDVEDWLKKVEDIKNETNRIFESVPEVQNGCCLNGTSSNLKLRNSLSREAMKLTAAVVELQKSGKFEKISYPAPPGSWGTGTISTAFLTCEFESRKHIEEDIMACLKDDTVFMVGVCGMGGVGKTTMAKKVVKRASEEKVFDEVVTAVVNQQADEKKIQQQIAEGLGLELRQDTISIRANLLHKRLMGIKKVLIVLDDVWQRLNLEELGIPSESMHKGCKIILTSRNHRLCIEMMSRKDATKIISMEVLHEKEALTLFREKAGSIVDEPDLHQLVIDVAKECKGLPLALVTVAGALREQASKPVWEDALRQLQYSAPTNIPGVLKDVYKPLQLSYKALESDEARYIFLLCCLFPEDSEISLDDLVCYGVALCIFSNIGNLREARNRVHGVVEILKSRFLLMDAIHSKDQKVMMHDVIRDMAIWISSQGKDMFMVSHDIGLREWPKRDSSGKYTCISLTLGESMAIPEWINCPKLEALRMKVKGQTATRKLPPNFFNKMRCLRLLSINRVLLSSSLHLPKQLGSLHLHDCGLEMISLLGGLVNLEILSLRGSNIEVVPDEIGALTKLKLLDLTECDNLKKITPCVISRLVELEDLRLLKCPIKWERDQTGIKRSNASLGEVFSLRNLSTLELWIRDLEVIPQENGQLQNLKCYSIIIGETSLSFPVTGTCTDRKRMIVHVDKKNGKNPCVNSMSVLFMGAQELDLSGIGSGDIIELLARQRFANLRHLKVSRLGTTKHLANNTIQGDITPVHGGFFPVLRWLELDNIYDLEEIFHGPPMVGSFSKLQNILLYDMDRLMYLWRCPNEKICLSNLKEMKIYSCVNLKWIFPLAIAESLCQLETIEITDCPIMEEVFRDEMGLEGGVATFNHIKLPKLNKMSLCGLPELCGLCKFVDGLEFPSIKYLEIKRVSPNFTIFSNQGDLLSKEVTYPDLDLSISELDMEIFYREVPIGISRGLRKLEIGACNSLRTLFSLDVFRGLVNLEVLIIRDCLILEEIVEKEENEEKGHRNVISKTIIPQLESLILSKLPKIHYFCSLSNVLELPSLKRLSITDCPLMETFALELSGTSMPNSISRFFFSKEVSFPSLQELVLQGLKVASFIFSQENRALEILKVESCHNLKSLFSSRIFRALTNLKQLDVSMCSMLEEIIGEEDDDDDEESRKIEVIWKLKLETLTLSELPKMRGFSYMDSDLELPSLRKTEIYLCTEMKSIWSPISSTIQAG